MCALPAGRKRPFARLQTVMFSAPVLTRISNVLFRFTATSDRFARDSKFEAVPTGTPESPNKPGPTADEGLLEPAQHSCADANALHPPAHRRSVQQFVAVRLARRVVQLRYIVVESSAQAAECIREVRCGASVHCGAQQRASKHRGEPHCAHTTRLAATSQL